MAIVKAYTSKILQMFAGAERMKIMFAMVKAVQSVFKINKEHFKILINLQRINI
jgi:hypothetical protein